MAIYYSCDVLIKLNYWLLGCKIIVFIEILSLQFHLLFLERQLLAVKAQQLVLLLRAVVACGDFTPTIHLELKCKAIPKFIKSIFEFIFFLFSGPVPVLILSLVFIASVFVLHIWGKYTRNR